MWYAFYSNFAAFSEFEKFKFFLEKKPIYIFYRTQILNVWRNLTISVAFSCKCAII